MGDPTTAISTPRDALSTASALLGRLSLTATDAGGARLWASYSVAPMAAMLYAVSPCGNGKGIDWLLAALRCTGQEPDWGQVAQIVAGVGIFHRALTRALELEPRQRESVAVTISDALNDRTTW